MGRGQHPTTHGRTSQLLDQTGPVGRFGENLKHVERIGSKYTPFAMGALGILVQSHQGGSATNPSLLYSIIGKLLFDIVGILLKNIVF